MSTPRSLITLALKFNGSIGLGQVAPTEDLNDAFIELQGMLAQWTRKRWLVPSLSEIVIPLTQAPSYTIGPGGVIDIPSRPSAIEAAFCRWGPATPQPLDQPFYVISSREEWSRIVLKGLHSVPIAVWLETSWPLGVVHVYPLPPAGSTYYELHLDVVLPIGAVATLDDDLGLPPEYDAAIRFNLAGRLRPYYQLPPDPTLTALAVDALATIRTANAQFPRARMPALLPGMRRTGSTLAASFGGGYANAGTQNGEFTTEFGNDFNVGGTPTGSEAPLPPNSASTLFQLDQTPLGGGALS